MKQYISVLDYYGQGYASQSHCSVSINPKLKPNQVAELSTGVTNVFG